MKFTVLVAIFASEILGVFSIIVYDGTKEPLKDQGSRRFSIQHAEPSQVSQQQVLPPDGTLTGFSSVVVHRPPNTQQSENHSGGGLTVKDPPKGWPLSEMHVSFDSHGKDDLKKHKEIKSSVTHKDHKLQQRQHINQVEHSFDKALQESHFHKQQHLHVTKRQPDQQRHQQEPEHQVYPLQQEVQQNVYQQRPGQQENLYQNNEKTEVEIHPQVIIKLPEQQTTRLLRPLYVQDQPFPEQLPSPLNTQKKPFHPSIQISDSVNNEAMLTPVQYHSAHSDAFSPMTKKPFSGSTKVTDSTTHILNNNNKAKNTYLAPGVNDEKFPRDGTKVVRMRHPQTTLGASYSVGFTTPADAYKNSNQLQNLIIKENVEHKGPIRHGKTLQRQKPSNAIEINNVPSKKLPPLQTLTYSFNSEAVRNDNYDFIGGGRYQVASSDTFNTAVNQPPPGAHSSSIRFHQFPNGQHTSSRLTLEEAQVPIAALHYQSFLTRDLVPPPARTHLSSEGKSLGTPPLGFLPPRTGHPNTVLTPNKIIRFVPGGTANNAFNEASNLRYISEAQNTLYQDYPSQLPHYAAGGVYDSGNEKGSQGSATTGSTVSSGIPVSQNHAHRHPGGSDHRGFSKNVPFYSTTQGHVQVIPTKLHTEFHTQQVIDATKHSASHIKAAPSAQGVKNTFTSEHPPQSNNPSSNSNQDDPQKGVENVFAGFKNGQFQGGFGGNIGYSFGRQDIRNPLIHTHLLHLGSNNPGVGAHGNAGQNVVQFDKNTPQNIPGYLNLNSGAVHLGHPAGPFLYPQQQLVQHPGGHVQAFYIPGAGVPHPVYTNPTLGVAHPVGMPTLVTNIQPSSETPVNQGHINPTGSVPATPAVFSGTPLTYFRGHVVNAAPQGNVEVSGQSLPQVQAVTFPGIGGAYPQSVHFPYNGGAGTTFVFSQAPLQDYSQQSHIQQVPPVGIQQHSSTFPARVNNVQTQNVGDVHANSFGVKLRHQQQQNSTPQHGTTSSSSQKQQASNM